MTEDGQGRDPRVLLVAFSARNAVAQTLDEIFAALSNRLDCRVMVPTNYSGKIPEPNLFRVRRGMGKIGGIAASINPVAHWKVVSGTFALKA